jgi:DNA-directed RNA polymerase subunit omega
MARVTVEDCLEKVENRFALVALASKRTKELKRGAPLYVTNRKNREVVMSLREIAQGKVGAKRVKESPLDRHDLIVETKSD